MIVVVSLAIKGDFEVTWSPVILKVLIEFTNLYNICKSYFNQQTGFTSSIREECKQGLAKGSSFGLSFLNTA